MIAQNRTDALLSWVERHFGHRFTRPALCEAALTHRSAGGEHNERLEFLGDSVLNLSVARVLYQVHANANEGDLSRLRASLVSGASLAQVAAELGLGEHLRLGAGELKSGGFRRASILADALEALIGAIFLDADFEVAGRSVERILGARLQSLPSAAELKDPKTRLQEMMQGKGLAVPTYTLTAVEGDAHARSFTVSCQVPVFGLSTVAEGVSRRRAEQLAAAKLIALLPPEMQNTL